MGIVVLIILYALLAVTVYLYINRFCAVKDNKRKTLIYIVFVSLLGALIETILKQGYVIYVMYFFIAYIFSRIIFQLDRKHSVAIGSIYILVRMSVVTLWALIFNIQI